MNGRREEILALFDRLDSDDQVLLVEYLQSLLCAARINSNNLSVSGKASSGSSLSMPKSLVRSSD